MIQSEYSKEDLEEIEEIAIEISKMDTLFYTGHCTGDVAYGILKEYMGEKLLRISDL